MSRQLETEFAEFVRERAEQIKAEKERNETPDQRQARLAQAFADAVSAVLTPNTDTQEGTP